MCPALSRCWTRCWSQSRQSWYSCLCPAEDSQPAVQQTDGDLNLTTKQRQLKLLFFSQHLCCSFQIVASTIFCLVEWFCYYVLDWGLGCCRDTSTLSWRTEWDLAIPVLGFRQQMAPLFSLIKLVLGIRNQLLGHTQGLWSSMPHTAMDCDNIFQHFCDKCSFKCLAVL